MNINNFKIYAVIFTFLSIATSCGEQTNEMGCVGKIIVLNNSNKGYFTSKNRITYYKGELFTGSKIKYYNYDTQGQLKFKEHFKDGKFSCTWESYWENGQLKTKKSFRDDGDYYVRGKQRNRIGLFEDYGRDGCISSKGEYNENGNKNGIWLIGGCSSSGVKELLYNDGELKE